MTFRVVIEEQAEREFVEAVNFYDARKAGLGQRFARDVRAFFEKVRQRPQRFALASRMTRKAKAPKPWPYSIYFTIKPESSEVIINAIWHSSRNPTELRRRLN